MAIKIKYTDLNPKSFVTATSRYASSKVILLGEKKVPVFELYKKRNAKMITGEVKWAEITPNVEFRPDLVSKELYGTPDFWWKLMEYNNMKDILEFKSGRVIAVPSSILP